MAVSVARHQAVHGNDPESIQITESCSLIGGRHGRAVIGSVRAAMSRAEYFDEILALVMITCTEYGGDAVRHRKSGNEFECLAIAANRSVVGNVAADDNGIDR